MEEMCMSTTYLNKLDQLEHLIKKRERIQLSKLPDSSNVQLKIILEIQDLMDDLRLIELELMK